MEKTVSARGIRLMYWAVSACFVVLTAWLYCREEAHIKILDISVMPENGRFQLELSADGKNIKVSAADTGVKLFVDESQGEENTHLLIHGECEEERELPVEIKVVSDSADWSQTWNCQVLVGTKAGKPEVVAFSNKGRKLYLWVALLALAITKALLVRGGKGKARRDLEIYSNKVIERLEQEPGMERCCREGKRLFRIYEIQEMFLRLLFAWLLVFLYCWFIHGIFHESQGIRGYKIWLMITGISALYIGALLRWRSLCNRLLIRECRPVTAAVTCLLMGNYGVGKKWSLFLQCHNGASGLYRSGHCREALELSDMAWQMLSKKPGSYIAYVHSSLKYQCLKVLEETEAAQEEKLRMEALLCKNPGLKRRKGIQRFLGIQDICQWMETGEIERAEKSAKEILGQWKEGYYRLPVLGLMAELKEFLGKEEETAKLRSEILTFSPENKEVRQVMGEGRLNYTQKQVRGWDPVLMIIFMVCIAGIAGLLLTM